MLSVSFTGGMEALLSNAGTSSVPLPPMRGRCHEPLLAMGSGEAGGAQRRVAVRGRRLNSQHCKATLSAIPRRPRDRLALGESDRRRADRCNDGDPCRCDIGLTGKDQRDAATHSLLRRELDDRESTLAFKCRAAVSFLIALLYPTTSGSQMRPSRGLLSRHGRSPPDSAIVNIGHHSL